MSAVRGLEQWRDWCWERNEQARAKGWTHWCYAKPNGEGGYRVDTVQGDGVRQIWDLLDDKPHVPHGMTEAQVQKSLAQTRWLIEQGVTPDVWMLWNQESRVARRRAYVAERLAGAA